MAEEIERKFLVPAAPGSDVLGAGVQIRQGYLAVDGPVEVRLRASEDAARLTIKGGFGLVRREVELPLGAGDARELWDLVGERRLEKVRHRVEIGAVVAEVDVYGGHLDGLCTAEVEFPSETAAAAFEPPAWFGEELTGDPAWSNAALARHGRPG